MKSILRNRKFMRAARLIAGVALVLVAAIYLIASGSDPHGAGISMALTFGIVSVSKLAEQVGSDKRERAKIHARQTEIFNRDMAIREELGQLQLAENSDDAGKAKLESLGAEKTKLTEEYKANEAKIAELSAKIDENQDAINRGNTLNAREAALQAPDGRHAPDREGELRHQYRTQVREVPLTARERQQQWSHDVGTWLRAAAVSNNNMHYASQLLQDWAQGKAGVDDFTRGCSVRLADALQAVNFASAGFLIPPTYVPQLIEYLRPRSIIRRMGPRMPGLINGQWTQPKLTAGTSAGYVGEGEALPLTSVSGGQLNLTAKQLSAKIPFSKNIIRYGSPGALEMVTADLIQAIAQAEDLAFIRNLGTGASPKGLRYWCPAANVVTANATVNLDNITHDMSSMMLCLEQAHIPMTNCHWGMAWRTYEYLANLRTSVGVLVFPTLSERPPQPQFEGAVGTYRGYPVHCTTQIPTNLGSGTNESEIYLVDADQLLLCEDPVFEMQLFDQATYTGSDGNLRSTAENQEVLLQVTERHDFGPRHAEAIAVMTEVDWGA